MDSFIYLLLETLIVGLMILGLYASKKHFGIGLLFIFIGTMQFFQTILSGNVYNLYFDLFLFSPGSTLVFISTLFAVLLIFRNESIIKVRSVIYGIILSNLVLVFLSYISLEQILSDNYSRNSTFLAEIFNFDITLFLTGIVLLYLDMILIVFVFRYLESKFSKSYFLQFAGATIFTAVLDSLLFYTLNFYSALNYSEMMIGNIAGKVLVCLILSTLFAFYFMINPQRESNKRKALQVKDILMIINFTTNGKR